ncbi:MAG: hypothetical protein NWF03_03430 [Candidatus Bathyarchaeota archaeon]|nr:hypothetical protein [Candidatus Bathyarchaeota archaeon]
MTYPRKFVQTSLLCIVLCLPLIGTVWAQTSYATLEWEQHWETYGVGGTCNFGTHNFYIGDVDGDDTLELITGGYMYGHPDYNWSEVQAPLRIWNWDGTTFTNEVDHYYQGMIGSIYADDIDGNGDTEIITGGYGGSEQGSYSVIKLWNWDGETLTSKAEYGGLSAGAIYVCDVDKDGTSEILTVGRSYVREEAIRQLSVLHWDGTSTSLELVAYVETQANSVYAYDLNNDGIIEIVTGGYSNDITESSGQICIWHFDQNSLSLQDSTEWKTFEEGYGVGISGVPMGNTMVSSLKVGDVDDDKVPEIVAGGFTYDGEYVNAQLTIWNWTTQTLMLEKDEQWRSHDITEVKSIVLSDVDGGGKLDIVNSGFIGAYEGFGDQNKPPEKAQLRVWSWNGKFMWLKVSEEWTIGEGVTAWNVGAGDLDKDGIIEMATVGCMYINNMCDPDLRIWSMPQLQKPFPLEIAAAIGVALGLLIIALFFLVKKTRD